MNHTEISFRGCLIVNKKMISPKTDEQITYQSSLNHFTYRCKKERSSSQVCLQGYS